MDHKAHAWATFLTAHAVLVSRIEQTLSAARLPELTWYDVLWELEKSEHGRLRMSELADRVVLSRSTVTRLVDRLERARLIERRPSAEDGRGYEALLTPVGRRMRAKMWPVYQAEIQRLFSAHISAAEAETIAQAFARAVKAARNAS